MPRVDSTLSQIAARTGQASTMPTFSRAVKTSHDHTNNALLIIILPLGAMVVGFAATGLIAWAAGLPVSVAFLSAGILGLVFLFGTPLWVIFGRLIEGKEEIWGPTVPPTAIPIGKPNVWPIEMHDPERPNNLDIVNFESEELRLAAVSMAYRMSLGTSFSEGALTAGSPKITRDQFYKLRDLFFARGWCYWRDEQHHTLGVVFTVAGKRIVRTWADLYLERTTPPPRISTPRVQKSLPAQTRQVGEWDEDEDWQEGEPDEDSQEE